MLSAPTKSANCCLCRRTITRAPGARLGGDSEPRLFHLNCFVAFTTGIRPDGDIWTYCIVASAARSWLLSYGGRNVPSRAPRAPRHLMATATPGKTPDGVPDSGAPDGGYGRHHVVRKS